MPVVSAARGARLQQFAEKNRETARIRTASSTRPRPRAETASACARRGPSTGCRRRCTARRRVRRRTPRSSAAATGSASRVVAVRAKSRDRSGAKHAAGPAGNLRAPLEAAQRRRNVLALVEALAGHRRKASKRELSRLAADYPGLLAEQADAVAVER